MINLTWTYPITQAKRTVYWFMYGKRYGMPPEHLNCRCVVKGIK